jgi:hypothetical protein
MKAIKGDAKVKTAGWLTYMYICNLPRSPEVVSPRAPTHSSHYTVEPINYHYSYTLHYQNLHCDHNGLLLGIMGNAQFT